MYDIPQETYYVMPMLDHSYLEWHDDDEVSLDKIATDVYGKKYVGQQTGEMLGNDTYHLYDLSTEDEVLEWLQDPEDMGFYQNPFSNSLGDITYHTVKGWLARDTSNDKYDFDDYREGPEPHTMLATLIHEGHLPYGKYLINVSW